MNKSINVSAGMFRLFSLIVLASVVAVVFAWFSRPQSAQTAPSHIAVIDVNKVLISSNAGKAAYTRLKTLQDGKLAQAKQMSDEIDALNREITTKKLAVSEAQLVDMQKRLS